MRAIGLIVAFALTNASAQELVTRTNGPNLERQAVVEYAREGHRDGLDLLRYAPPGGRDWRGGIQAANPVGDSPGERDCLRSLGEYVAVAVGSSQRSVLPDFADDVLELDGLGQVREKTAFGAAAFVFGGGKSADGDSVDASLR